jgi:ribonuclease HI
MGKADKKHANGREGLAGLILKHRAPPKQLNLQKLQRQVLKNTGRLRRDRIRDSILGHKGSFAGEIRTNAHEAWANDADRLHDILEDLNAGRAIAYWVDGSLGGKIDKKGVVGAGVDWHTGQYEYTCTYKLGRWTGNSADAEVFGIAAALGRAKKSGEKGKKYELVRVYSDAVHLLEEPRKGNLQLLGPLLAKKTALQALFERAEWLEEKGVKVKLIWVKGHKNSRANRLADQTAPKAVQEGAEESYSGSMNRRWMFRADVPSWCTELGSDWEDEWLSRANKDFGFLPEFLNPHLHPGALGAMRDDVEAMSIDKGSPECKNEDVDVQLPMTVTFLSWKKPDDPVQKHTFRDLWGTNSEEAGEETVPRGEAKDRIGTHDHEPYDPTSYYTGLTRMEAAVEEYDVGVESPGVEGIITSRQIALSDRKRHRLIAQLDHNFGGGKNTLEDCETISYHEGAIRMQAAIDQRDVGLEDTRRGNAMVPLSNVEHKNMEPSAKPRYSLRSSVAHPNNGPIQQPLIQIPTINQPIDRSVTDLRKHIEACVTVISNVRQRLGYVGNKRNGFTYTMSFKS